MNKLQLHTLPNGLKVLLAPCEAESVAFGLFVASGSRHEAKAEQGISHFIEHMLFKGTKKRRAIDIIQAIEGRGGNFNACTSEESTCYFAHLPDEYLGEAVDIISDMFLNASIPEDEFLREKKVVMEEIKMYGDDPESVVMENLQRALFPNNPLGIPIAGFIDTLEPMKPTDLRKYMRRNYTTDRTVAVVVGRFDPAKAIDLVAKAFSKARSAKEPNARKNDSFSPPIAEISASKDVQQTQLAIGYRTFGVNDERKYAATLMDVILGRGMSSRLFQEIREKRGLSYDIASRLQFFSDTGMFTITGGLDGSKVQLAMKTIDRELKKIRTKKVPAAELRRAKEFLIGNFRLGHERITSKLFFYGSILLSFGKIVTIEEQVDSLRAVTADDIISVANDIIRPEMRSVSFVVPK